MSTTISRKTVLITGAAGLVGQNLIASLKRKDAYEIIAADKHTVNTQILQKLHPEVRMVITDFSDDGAWETEIGSVDVIVMLHAQIGGLQKSEFDKNNVKATQAILQFGKSQDVEYLVHVSSSVVNSSATDFYTESKKEQEILVESSDIKAAILRPTLMFGWFDRKHFGWLQRFMKRFHLFPVPGSGRYLRQPLFVGDFCSIIDSCLSSRCEGVFNISGLEQVDYIDIIRSIRKVSSIKALIFSVPYSLFHCLLTIYALMDKDPPFTTTQLKALVIPEVFEVIDWPSLFRVEPTPLEDALEITFNDPTYSSVVLDF